MKKILGVLMIVFVTLSTSSIVFAGVNVKPSKHIIPFKNNFESSLEKSIKSIAPAGTNATEDQLKAQIDAIKKIIEGNNAISKQINEKQKNATKLTSQIKKNKQLLTSAQYATINSILAQIDAEKKNAVKNSVDSLLGISLKLDLKSFSKLTAQEVTNLQNTLNQNTSSLNKISSYYDSILAILNTTLTTTPAAITTTPAGITK